jgi:hypothetical protein
MSGTSVPKLVVDEKIEIGVSLIGVLASAWAGYHTGQTGNWDPLMAIAMGLALVVLFVTSE